MDINKYILNQLTRLDNNVSAIARIDLKRYKHTIFLVSILGTIAWLQNSEIKELKRRVRANEMSYSELNERWFNVRYSDNTSKEVTPDE